MTGRVAISAFMVVSIFVACGWSDGNDSVAKLPEPALSSQNDLTSDKTETDFAETTEQVRFLQSKFQESKHKHFVPSRVDAHCLVGTWVSEIKRKFDWEPKARTIGHYSDMAYAVEGMTEVYVLECDGTYVRTVTNPDYSGRGLVKLVHWGDWKVADGLITLTAMKSQLITPGGYNYVTDFEESNERALKEGGNLIVFPVMVFRLDEDHATFVFESTKTSFRDGLNIVFRKQSRSPKEKLSWLIVTSFREGECPHEPYLFLVK